MESLNDSELLALGSTKITEPPLVLIGSLPTKTFVLSGRANQNCEGLEVILIPPDLIELGS